MNIHYHHTEGVEQPHLMRCVGCGYDLRASDVKGICPECGLPCESSAWYATTDGRRWQRFVKRGALLLFTGMVIMELGRMAWLPFYIFVLHMNQSLRWVDWILIYIFPGIFGIAGTLLLTIPNRNTNIKEKSITIRRAAKYIMVAGWCGMILQRDVNGLIRQYTDHYVWTPSGGFWESIPSDLFLALVSLIVVVGFITICVYIRKLAVELHADNLKWHAKITIIGLVIFNSAAGILWLVCDWPLPGTGKTLLEPSFDNIAYRLINFSTAMASLIYEIWFMLVLWLLYRRLRLIEIK